MVKVVAVMVANICPLRETRCPSSAEASSSPAASTAFSVPSCLGPFLFGLVAAYIRGAPSGQYMACVTKKEKSAKSLIIGSPHGSDEK